MASVDFREIFALDISALEIILRGTIIYWFIFIIFRIILRRDAGAVGIADVLLLVLIADASQNAMAADYHSISAGCILIATLVFWNVLIDWLCYRFPFMERLLEPAPLCLIRDGKVQRSNLRKELISIRDLLAKLREEGVDDVAKVRRAYMESDGSISVIKKEAA